MSIGRMQAYFGLALVWLAGSARAAPPQSDDFNKGLGPFWKIRQIQRASTPLKPGSQKTEKGQLVITSANNDIWKSTVEPYLIYQEVTGDFTVQLKVIQIPQCNEWSDIGLMVVNAPVPEKYSLPAEIPTWWELYASRSHGSGSKGGGQGKSREVTAIEGIQPPYWLRMDRQGQEIRVFYSIDGAQTWSQLNDGQSFDLSNENVEPLNDAVAIGIEMETHCGSNTLATGIVDSFVAGDLSQAGKLPIVETMPATVTGTLTDDKAAPVPTTVVIATASDGTVLQTRTAADGTFTMYLDPGTYTFGILSDLYSPPESKPITITPGQETTVDLKVANFPNVNLSSHSTDTTVTAKAWGGGDDPTRIDPSDWTPAQPGFDEKDFAPVDWPGDLGSGNPVPDDSWFWYRVSFKLPDAWKANKGREAFLYNFNIDDGDITWVNGHYVGHTPYSAGAIRSYMVPGDFVNWDGDNLIAILGSQGPGGAGATQTTQEAKIRLAPVTEGALYGKIVTETGASAGGLNLTLTGADGTKTTAASSLVDGSYRFTGLKPGDYTVGVDGLARSAPAPLPATVVGGQTTMLADLKIEGVGFGPSDAPSVDLSKLTGVDVDAPVAGSDRFDSGTLSMEASGSDIWGPSDQFRYAALPNKVTGDFTASVQVRPPLGTSDWSKAGIMIRESMDPGSVNILAYASGLRGPWLQGRLTAGGDTVELGVDEAFRYGEGILLTRKGDDFAMYRANEDGSGAALVGQQALPGFPKELLIGLAVTSHSSGMTGKAQFRSLKVANAAWTPDTGAAVALGDVNGDGQVTIQDATLALRAAVSLPLPDTFRPAAGDINKDGKINLQDVTQILGKAIGLPVGF